MNDQSYFVLLLILVVLLPLLPSFILFKFLPSDGDVEGPFKGMKIKFQGAFAGYFVILVFIGVPILKIGPAPNTHYEVWHVSGQAVLGNSEKLLETDITVNPPHVTTSTGGTFFLDVPVTKIDGNKLKFPTISVGHDGFNSIDIPLDDNITAALGGTAPISIKKDRASKSITIEKFELQQTTPYELHQTTPQQGDGR
jgi:hypothetical protein